jgi:predicted nucleic acid-binding protein
VIVADTNLVTYLFVAGEHTPQARSVWQRDADWRLPPLWRTEFLNVLATAVRTGVLDAAAAMRAWHTAVSVLGTRELEPRGDDVLRLAVERGISAYDAQFVAVARELGVLLVSGDKRLVERGGSQVTALAAFATGA